jgi:hypothetical protein
MPQINRNSQQFKRGVREERKEHPDLPEKYVSMLVENHIRLHPYMYKK